MSEREARVANNERLFREINERISRIQEAFGQMQAFDIVCECGAKDCLERITLTHESYRALRADPRTFAIVPGHEAEDIEKIVERHDAYYVVEKEPGTPAAIAESDQ